MGNNGKSLDLGILMLSVGIIWLLSIAGIVTVSTAEAALTLWPLILVAIGICIIFKNKKYIKIATWLVLLAVVIGYGYFAKPSPESGIIGRLLPGGEQAEEREKKPEASLPENSKDSDSGNEEVPDSETSKVPDSDGHTVIEKGREVEKAKLALKFGATQIYLKSGAGANNLVEADVSKELSSFIDHSESERDGGRQADVEFNMRRFNFSDMENLKNLSSEFYINGDILWELDFDTGAVDGNLDLTGLKMEKLDIDTGAAKFDIAMGSFNTKMNIDAGASTFRIALPGDTGIRIKLDGALNNTNFDEDGWVKKDGWYYSPEYDSRNYKIEADVNMGVGKLTVEDE